MRLINLFSAILFFLVNSYCVNGQSSTTTLAARLQQVTPRTEWILKDSLVLSWNVHHTQGMVKVKEYYYISSVEIIERTKLYERPEGKLDRTQGRGKGHLFKVDSKGQLIKDIHIGEGAMYHPSGLDFDGRYLWFAVAEYRPHSVSVMYRLDTENDVVERLFEVADHIGAVAYNPKDKILVGGTWGSSAFYKWRISNLATQPKQLSYTKRTAWYVDFQDTKYIGDGLLFGSGIKSYKHKSGVNFALGGWELVDWKTLMPVWQLPINRLSHKGNSLVNNPCTINLTSSGIEAHFLPDDDNNGVIYRYHFITP
jgi:hypothetical protein